MLLKSIKYHNFRPFIGNQDINFEITDPEKNVTVILGDNTFGKSTVVLSFIWCLYGESRFNHPNDILNKKLEKKIISGEITSETASVTVVFEDEGKIYTMRRSQTFSLGPRDRLKTDRMGISLSFIDEDGVPHNVGQTESEINLVIKSILPKDLSEFFFFEGEKDNELSKKDLSKAVKTLLGLEAYDKMRNHLHGPQSQVAPSEASVMGEYLKKQNTQSDERAQLEFRKQQEAETKVKAAKDRIEQIDKDIAFYEEKLSDINRALREAAPTKEIQNRREQLLSSITREESALKGAYKNLFKEFNRNALSFFEMPFIDKADARLSEMKISDKGIKGINAKAIRMLIDRKECLCGAELIPGTKAYDNVNAYLEILPPKALGTLVTEMKEEMEGVKESGEEFFKEFTNIYREITVGKNTINDLQKKEAACREELSSIKIVDVSNEEDNLNVYTSRLKNLRFEKDEKNNEIGVESTKQETAAKNFNMLKAKSGKAKEYQEFYKYAEALYDWVNANYSAKENEMRKRLNVHVQELFNSIYSGKRDIVIDDKYNVVMTYDGDDVDTTGGLRVIQYFSYVGGLVELANEIKNERKTGANMGDLGEEYPLVLDAAFSHADETHTMNISKHLSDAVVQLVFAVMPKDWQYAEKGISGRVNRIYELRKIDETEVTIDEVK